MSVASFQRLNNTKPAIKALKVGLRNVKGPREVEGLIAGAINPNRKPATEPFKGPSRGAAKLESNTLDKVICAGVPGIGYKVKNTITDKTAVQIAIKATCTLLNLTFPENGFTSSHPCDAV